MPLSLRIQQSGPAFLRRLQHRHIWTRWEHERYLRNVYTSVEKRRCALCGKQRKRITESR